MEKQTRITYSECVCSVAFSILHAMRMRFIVIYGLCETVLILRRIQQDMIKMCIDLHVKCPLFLFDLLEISVFWTDFRKYSKYHHHHHHKHQGLDPLIRSASRVTAARTNASSVFQFFSLLVVCSGMISKGFGFVAFFASVKASSVCIHLL